jgi:LAO/AO transport system kinase
MTSAKPSRLLPADAPQMKEQNLAQAILAGDRLALARTLSQIENGSPTGRDTLSELFQYTGKAHLVGITGASGTGKSSLVNQLTRHIRQSDSQQRVAIVAVDPTSPFTGGAILGDRIRMRDLAGDPGVFIRSMATRGSLGGIASATASVVQVLDAAGFDLVLIETVGAGQSEVDIARLAHTTIVVESPGLGDDIQAIKAGIMEIADIFVVNKADLPGVENTERALRSSLNLAHPIPHHFLHHGQLETSLSSERSSDTSVAEWMPPILRTVALDGNGIGELDRAIRDHRNYLESSGDWEIRERWRLQTEFDLLLQSTLVDGFLSHLPAGEYEHTLDEIILKHLSPFEAVAKLIHGNA